MRLLRPLSEWIGPCGTVVGTDIDERQIAAAASFERRADRGRPVSRPRHRADHRRASSRCPRATYLRLPLQFASSLEPRLLQLVGIRELDELRARAGAALADPERWGTTFTLVQSHGRVS